MSDRAGGRTKRRMRFARHASMVCDRQLLPNIPGDRVNDCSKIRPQHRALVLFLAALGFAAASASTAAPAPASAELPLFAPDTSVIEASDELSWIIPFRVENRFPVGIYFDSLICEVQDLDPGETRGERLTVLDVSHVVNEATASAGEVFTFSYVAPAMAEHARLTFRLGLHRADKSRTTLTTVVEAMPGPVSRDHASQFLDVNGRRVEYVLFPAGRDSAPGLLLVHGRGGQARTMMRMALRLAPRGYTVMLVSMPGYGQSVGPVDLAGPSTVQSLGAALDRLEATPGVNPKRLAAWGVSLGAAAVTLLAQGRDDLRATIAESGFYDLWAIHRATKIPRLREDIVHEAGSDSGAWRDRSAALGPGKPEAIFILHGEKDDVAPAQQARGFAESLRARGADVESRFFPNSGHQLPPGEVMRTALEFLGRRLGR